MKQPRIQFHSVGRDSSEESSSSQDETYSPSTSSRGVAPSTSSRGAQKKSYDSEQAKPNSTEKVKNHEKSRNAKRVFYNEIVLDIHEDEPLAKLFPKRVDHLL